MERRDMHCARFEELLFERLEGRLGAADERRLRAHAASCRRCRELEALVAGGPGLPEVEPPTDLLAAILERTSGSACGRARGLLARRFDEELGEVGAPLSAHLEVCAGCRALAGALERLRRELPKLAELSPGADFLEQVMTATVGAAASPRAALADGGVAPVDAPAGGVGARLAVVGRLPAAGIAARLRAFWQRLAQRPRIALEGAYLVTVALMLVSAMTPYSVSGTPSRLAAGLRAERMQVERALASRLESLSLEGRRWWAEGDSLASASAREVATYVSGPVRRVVSRLDGFARGWGSAGLEMAARAWQWSREAVAWLQRQWQRLVGAGEVERESVRDDRPTEGRRGHLTDRPVEEGHVSDRPNDVVARGAAAELDELAPWKRSFNRGGTDERDAIGARPRAPGAGRRGRPAAL